MPVLSPDTPPLPFRCFRRERRSGLLRHVPRLPYVPGTGIRRGARLATILRAYANEVRKCAFRFPAGDVVFGARHGFAADRVYLYGREAIVSGEYLSDFQRQFTRFINPKPVRELLEDKVLFAGYAAGAAKVPENLLYSDNGKVTVLSSRWFEIMRDISSPPQRFVMKRSRGGGGIKISFVDIAKGVVRIGERQMSTEEFYGFFATKDDYILCRFVRQSGFFSNLYPHTTNTLRVACMRDPDGEPFIASAALRLGTRKSGGVDNFGRGGLACSVDVGIGVLADAVEHFADSPSRPGVFAAHPDTGSAIAGQALPGWAAARDQSLQLMRAMPFINYVGWDIVVTDAGPVFLEGNNYTGVRLLQSRAGLLADPRVRDFYERFGIVPGRG